MEVLFDSFRLAHKPEVNFIEGAANFAGELRSPKKTNMSRVDTKVAKQKEQRPANPTFDGNLTATSNNHRQNY